MTELGKIKPEQKTAEQIQTESLSKAAPPSETDEQKKPLETLLADNSIPTWRKVAWPVMGFMALIIFWSTQAQLDEVSAVEGEVVPLGKVKVIQHLEGGIIEQLHVNEGDTVRAGMPLVQLDLATSGVNRNELLVRLDSQLLLRARLEAEADGLPAPIFPEDVSRRRASMVQEEMQAFQARRNQLNSKISVLKEQTRQRELEVQELEARRRAVAKNLRLAQERFKMSKSLLAEGLTAKIEHLELEAEVESLRGEKESLAPALPRAQAAIAEAKARAEEEEIRFRREAQEELGKTDQSIARVQELLVEATEQGVRAEIKSPIDGVVKNMRYNTIGGVVKPGEPILEIVPTGGKLVVEAKLNPTDRGYVNVGQRTVVKISTYDFARYGGLEGHVAQVAPDSSTDEDGTPYFRVIVETDKTYLGKIEGDLPITPGMQATVDIHTGQKSVMEYLIKPVLKLRHEAFRER